MIALKKLAIGIDIGGTRTKIGLVDLDLGKVLEIQIVPTETKDAIRFEQIIGDAICIFKTKVNTEILGVGIGVSSFVFEDGTVDSTYGFMDFMEDYPLKKIIENTHQLPCKIDNDARLVALGEALYGKGKGYERVLVLTLGTGLGLGFVVNQKLNEKLPYGHMGGHIIVTENHLKCYCGKSGCLESLVSATAIVEAAKRINFSQKYPEIILTAAAIFQASEMGNLDAQKLLESVVKYLKIGIQNYINLYAPDKIILGGGVAKGLKNYLPMLQENAQLGPYKQYKFSIEISELEENAGILGSAALFIDSKSSLRASII
jgi:glucokinase